VDLGDYVAWLVVDYNDNELIFNKKPYKAISDMFGNPFVDGYYEYNSFRGEQAITLPKGSIKKLIGFELTQKDLPIEYS
jgi:hypothetical protein